MSKRTNKLSIPVIMNVTGDQALATGTLVGSGSALNVANGQLGVLSWDYTGTKPLGTFIASTDDPSEVRAIKLITGTPASANTQLADVWEVGDKGYLESGVIRADKIRSVAIRKARYGRYGGFLATGFAVPEDNVDYKAYVRLLSVRNDRTFGANDDVLSVVVPGYDFTTFATVSPKDYVLKNIVTKINGYSKLIRGSREVVAFGVKIAGGTGTTIGTIAPGTNVPFQTINGTTYSITADEAFVTALAKLNADSATLTGTSSIVNVNVATAGTVADVDAIIVLGLPAKRAAYYDNIEQTQTSAEVTFGGGFDYFTDTNNNQVDTGYPTVTKMWAEESINTGVKLRIQSRDRYLLTVHTKQNHPHGEWFSEGKDYINESKLYTTLSIDYYDTENPLTTEVTSPKNVTLLFPCEKLSTFTATVNNVTTEITAGNAPITMVTSNDAGTGTASVNTSTSVTNILINWLSIAKEVFGKIDFIADSSL
jgi:hypothetical protein